MQMHRVSESSVVVVSDKSYNTGDVFDSCLGALAGTAPALILAFVGGRHSPDYAVQRIHAYFGDVPIVGGAAAGVITKDMAQYTGAEVCLIAFMDAALAPAVLTTDRLLEGEFTAGVDLGKLMAAQASEDATVVVLYDSVRVQKPLQLHPASSLVDGILQGLGTRRVELVGGGTLTDLAFSASFVFDGRNVAHHTAVALVFPPRVKSHTIVCHGCVPSSAFMTITKIEGAEIFELGGKPALEVIEQLLGTSAKDGSRDNLSLVATIGHKQGDPFGPFEEGVYVNRLILKGDRSTGSITIFEPDFKVGALVQIMFRDNQHMVDSVRDGARRMNVMQSKGRPLLTLWIDCAGRARMKSGSTVEEADVLRETLSHNVPLAGFYSGVEIAPFDGHPRPLDWTGVLTHLYVEA